MVGSFIRMKAFPLLMSIDPLFLLQETVCFGDHPGFGRCVKSA